MQSLSPRANFNFGAGISQSQGSSFDFSEFEDLARRLLDYTDGIYTVKVVDQGGQYSSVGVDVQPPASWATPTCEEQLAKGKCPDRKQSCDTGGNCYCAATCSATSSNNQRPNTWYDLYDFRPGGQGEDNGATLAVFTGAGTVGLRKTNDGRKFGPTVLAPLAHVLVDGDVGFVDGSIIARSVHFVGQNQGSVQLHGDAYQGPLQCKDAGSALAVRGCPPQGSPAA